MRTHGTTIGCLTLGAALAVAGAAPARPARAQATQPRTALTLAGAKRIMAATEAEAERQHFPASIAIVDEGGNLLLMERTSDRIVASARVAVGKARTSAIFRRPTSAFEEIIKNGRTAMVALDDFTPLQGGVPIVVNGEVVGAIGVSGNNPPKDEQIALAGASALGGSQTSAAAAPGPSYGATGAPVTFFGHDAVTAAFAKGAVLYDGGSHTYMVHASRRDAPGMAEVHTLDTDIIYVLDGGATFVTGGTMVDGKSIAPTELRGRSLSGGETRRLVKGDVIIVPQNTPHWFREVRASFTYYAVKVR